MTNFEHASEQGLKKTTSHLYSDVHLLLKRTAQMIEETRHIGSNRTKGLASMAIIAVTLIIQGGTFFGLNYLKTNSASNDNHSNDISHISQRDRTLISGNIARINQNVEQIITVKNKVAPAMPIDQNITAIQTSVDEIKNLTGTPEGQH